LVILCFTEIYGNHSLESKSPYPNA